MFNVCAHLMLIKLHPNPYRNIKHRLNIIQYQTWHSYKELRLFNVSEYSERLLKTKTAIKFK